MILNAVLMLGLFIISTFIFTPPLVPVFKELVGIHSYQKDVHGKVVILVV